jgi:hypothetical protein
MRAFEEVQPMAIDRTSFLFMAGALAAGGVGGWAYRDREAVLARSALANTPAPQVTAAAVPSGPVPVNVIDSRVATTAACDDSQGTPEECPTVGPADEGVCANVILKRCQEFKAAFKPKVATAAVACLRALKPAERCDPARINQCGHLALMNACPDPAPPLSAQLQSSSGREPPTVTITLDATTPPSPVATACDALVKSCASQPLAPSLSDCRQTMAGLNDVGRASMVDCVTAHCNDRGLYGCEAVPKPTAGSAVVSR